MRGASSAAQGERAARELAEQIAQPDAAVAIVFASVAYELEPLVAALERELAPTPVVGCTSGVEISPSGFSLRSLVGVTLASPGLRVGIGHGTCSPNKGLSGGRDASRMAVEQLGLRVEDLDRHRHVGITLIDSRGGCEEQFIAGAAGFAPGVSFVGGSASSFRASENRSRTFARGQVLEEHGLVLLFESRAPFSIVFTDHMLPSEGKVVVTATDAGNRLVHELNGRPAREVYERICGIPNVTTALAAQHPFGYYVGGRAYVRSVMGVEGDSLRFACGVERGTVLVPMRRGAMIPTTENALEEARRELGGDMSVFIAFHCMGRFMETETLGITDEVGALLARYPVIGFNTYGEQVNSLHVNHTLTGVAFGRRDRQPQTR